MGILTQYCEPIAYGVRDGELLFVADVPRGLRCGCVCERCGGKLIAKKGLKRRPHFAHRDAINCHGASESVLHRLSKEILAGLESLMIPPYKFDRRRTTKTGRLVQHQATVANGGCVRVDRVTVEVSEEGFIPDVMIESRSKKLIVEVAVSHKVARDKLRKMRARNLPAIEIRLEPIDALLSREELKAKLQLDLVSKVWLFHPAQRDAERDFVSKWRSANALSRVWSRTRASILIETGVSPKLSARSRSNLSAHDRSVEDFYRANGRYPSSEECVKYWPHLWKPKM